MQPVRHSPRRKDSEFLDSLRQGMIIGVGLLILAAPASWLVQYVREHVHPQRVAVAPQLPVPAPRGQPVPLPGAPAAPAPERVVPAVQLADFRGEDPTPDARLVANWALTTHNPGGHAFVVVDKKDARVYVFRPDGILQDSAPALLGSARGDDTFPGVGDKPLEQVRPEEKTTPAGRFVAERGFNSSNEDVVWVDYNAAVSMHRIRPVSASERRLERLASLTTDDNRISFGCINLPVSFYENVLSPMVKKYGAVIYVLPEVKTAQEVLGAFDVTDPIQLAAASRQPPAAPSVQKVAYQQR